MEFNDWEIDLEIANGKRAFYELCRKSLERQGLIEYINAEHPQLLKRIALEIDIGELDVSSDLGAGSFEQAQEYFIRKMSFVSKDEEYYGINRAAWIKPSVVTFLEKSVYVNYFNVVKEIPDSLLADKDILIAALSSNKNNIFYFDLSLVELHAEELLLGSHGLFSNYLNMDNADSKYAAQLITRNPSLYREITKYEENCDFSDIYAARIDKVQKTLSDMGWNPRDHKKKGLIKRIQKAFVEAFTL